MSRRAKFTVTFDLLAEMLRLPDDARVIGVHAGMDDMLNKRRFWVYVEHPDLYEVPEGAEVPSVKPRVEFSWGKG